MALLFGIILSATDPVAVVALLKELGQSTMPIRNVKGLVIISWLLFSVFMQVHLSSWALSLTLNHFWMMVQPLSSSMS